jgi:hypothetical protein
VKEGEKEGADDTILEWMETPNQGDRTGKLEIDL